jgi:hypothetical protein
MRDTNPGLGGKRQILYREELDSMAAEMPLDLKLVLSEPPSGWRGPVGELSPEMLDAC